jgi:Fibronectin type III domain
VVASGLVSTNRSAGVAAVSWSAPSDGGSPITSYRVTATPGGAVTTVAAPSTSTVFGNLQNGTGYTFSVQAQNAVGLGAPSGPTGPAVPYSYPAPATNVAADLQGGGAVVRWDAPADDGGRPVTGYHLTAAPGPITITADASQRRAAFSGLTAGTSYTFTVTAANEAGDSAVDATSTATGIVAAAQTPPNPNPAAAGSGGYWMVTAAGKVYGFGVPTFGDAPTGTATHIEPHPSGAGYWVLDANGTVSNFGTAPALGNASLHAGEKAVSLSATPTGTGYWVFTDKGRAIPFGTAAFHGDMADARLNGPILGSVATPDGHGYWMVGSDGGIFSFGTAVFHGSTGNIRVNKPVMAMAPAANGAGYWLVASDGGIFAFDVAFFGSMGGTALNKPVTGMVPGRNGYLMVGQDGGTFAFGDVAFHGSLGSNPPASPVVSVALVR